MTRDQSEDGIEAKITMYANVEEPRYVGVFKARLVLYVAHPLRPTEDDITERFGAPVDAMDLDRRKFAIAIATKRNAERAIAWRNWLRNTFPEVTFVAPWIGDVLAGDDDSDPAQRERGIRDNCALIAKLDGIVLCGPRISAGMRAEILAWGSCHAHPNVADGYVYDLTSLGAAPPDRSAAVVHAPEIDPFSAWAAAVQRGAAQ